MLLNKNVIIVFVTDLQWCDQSQLQSVEPMCVNFVSVSPRKPQFIFVYTEVWEIPSPFGLLVQPAEQVSTPFGLLMQPTAKVSFVIV